MDGFANQLRVSLQKLNSSLQSEQEVLRQATQKDKPVEATEGAEGKKQSNQESSVRLTEIPIGDN